MTPVFAGARTVQFSNSEEAGAVVRAASDGVCARWQVVRRAVRERKRKELALAVEYRSVFWGPSIAGRCLSSRSR